MLFCDAPLSDVQSPCVRSFWSSLVPALLVLVYISVSLPIRYPRIARKAFRNIAYPFQPFLTLSEAEENLRAAAGLTTHESTTDVHHRISIWRTTVLIVFPLVESLAWIAYGCYTVVAQPESLLVDLFYPFVQGSVWLYATVRPVARPISTTPFDLFTLYLIQFLFSIVEATAVAYNRFVLGLDPPAWPLMSLLASKSVVSLAVLIAIMGTPLFIPSISEKLDKAFASTPEDSTTLWSWISFSWIEPLIAEGRSRMLHEDDVYSLSSVAQSKPVFTKFNSIQSDSLLRKLLIANRLDLFLDFSLTIVSVFFNYAAPFLLNQILNAFDSPDPEAHSRGYIYAGLAFICLITKAQFDAQHLYFGRRAAARTRLELMASVYDKALKRRDLSGTFSSTTDDKAQVKQKRTKKTGGKKKKDTSVGADIGKVVNLMSGDSNRVASFVASAYFLYGAPVEIAIAATFLYSLLGWAAFVGFFVLVLSSPLNHFLSKRGVKINKELLAARDVRMGILNELMSAVKFIKFFAWEEQFIDRVQDARGKELKVVIRERANSIMFSLLWSVAPVLVSIVSFFTYTVIQGKQLSVPIAFTAIALFNMLKMPLNVIPSFIVQGLQASVALKRIEAFLGEEEVPPEVSSLKRNANGPHSHDDHRLGTEGATFRWIESTSRDGTRSNGEAHDAGTSQDDRKFELSDMSVIFPPGKLSVVTGPTASGKSALLLALLGELTLIPGGRLFLPKDPASVDENGLSNSISYCAQTPWLQHLSIRDNILFGSPYNKERYELVLECCALNPDLAILEDGDETEVGTRGVTLSGGQKARVALARAAYSHTKNVLLDDIFAAVDSHTARHLWDKLFRGQLMANRTVVLVTHHLDLVLNGAQYIVRLLDGRIDLQGDVEELRSQGLLNAIIVDEAQQLTGVQTPARVAEAIAQTDDNAYAKTHPRVKGKRARQLVEDEARASGNVKWIVYRTYLKACSYSVWAFVLLVTVLYSLNSIGEKLWIRQWGLAYEVESALASRFLSLFQQHAHDEPVVHYLPLPMPGTNISTETLPPASTDPMFYVLIYASITLAGTLLSTINTVVQYAGAYYASRRLFTSLLVTVVRAPMRWFDTTPLGRILNRFGSDIVTIDYSISASIRSTTTWVAAFIAALLTVAVVLPAFLPAACIVGYFYYNLSLGYVHTGRDLRRMESNTRSPIFASFGELLDGIVTVRAYSGETRFFDVLHHKLNTTTKMWYTYWMLNRYLLLHFDFLSAISILLTTVFALSGAVDAGTAGLTITSAMTFSSCAYWTCRTCTQLEMDINAVERVVEYLDIPQEPAAVVESSRPPAFWPSSSGAELVRVEDLVIKYAPGLEPVISGVSFTLRGGERVGLIGRTGSGKSTLAMAFLRFVEPAHGKIIIDGIDITTIGLRDLRSRLTIIPQDAVLFSGSIRENLDPFSDRSDEEILDALFRVQLMSLSEYTSRKSSRASTRVPSRAPSIHGNDETMPGEISPLLPDTPESVPAALSEGSDQKVTVNLDTQVSAGGLNFSQGQRQLIAMARALLRQSAIVIMDEATSSIDFETDAKIQTAIREEFKHNLLITIAHRLRTVIDYDRLIVMDAGRIVELNTPANLIKKEGGVFRNMCLKSGEFDQLEADAMRAARRDAT